jgi:hypothetical protein
MHTRSESDFIADKIDARLGPSRSSLPYAQLALFFVVGMAPWVLAVWKVVDFF